ncbi:uncharacterized protein LOC115288558 isoform X1 [Suricata suricatta]|uniref:uncharacterized protein LOC115288558 isoform X1 n=1 Tax=Suricata suricatta TaxID=37032 RepID=UPI001155EB46|nr:uncharacterized protein LOC115288558 isoform X1 [Suricata suricatta]
MDRPMLRHGRVPAAGGWMGAGEAVGRAAGPSRRSSSQKPGWASRKQRPRFRVILSSWAATLAFRLLTWGGWVLVTLPPAFLLSWARAVSSTTDSSRAAAVESQEEEMSEGSWHSIFRKLGNTIILLILPWRPALLKHQFSGPGLDVANGDRLPPALGTVLGSRTPRSWPRETHMGAEAPRPPHPGKKGADLDPTPTSSCEPFLSHNLLTDLESSVPDFQSCVSPRRRRESPGVTGLTKKKDLFHPAGMGSL